MNWYLSGYHNCLPLLFVQSYVLQKQHFSLFLLFFVVVLFLSIYVFSSVASFPSSSFLHHDFFLTRLQIILHFHMKFHPSHPSLEQIKLSPSLLHWSPWVWILCAPWSLCCCCFFENDISFLPQSFSASQQIYNFYFLLQHVCVLIATISFVFICISCQSYPQIFFFFSFHHHHHWQHTTNNFSYISSSLLLLHSFLKMNNLIIIESQTIDLVRTCKDWLVDIAVSK